MHCYGPPLRRQQARQPAESIRFPSRCDRGGSSRSCPGPARLGWAGPCGSHCRGPALALGRRSGAARKGLAVRRGQGRAGRSRLGRAGTRAGGATRQGPEPGAGVAAAPAAPGVGARAPIVTSEALFQARFNDNSRAMPRGNGSLAAAARGWVVWGWRSSAPSGGERREAEETIRARSRRRGRPKQVCTMGRHERPRIRCW